VPSLCICEEAWSDKGQGEKSVLSIVVMMMTKQSALPKRLLLISCGLINYAVLYHGNFQARMLEANLRQLRCL
jgi:hypothetical protein